MCWTHSFGLAACKRKKREPAVKNVTRKKICVSNWRTFYILSTYLSSFLKKRSPKCMLTSSAKQQTSVELYMCSSGYGIYTLHLRGNCKIVFTGRIVLLSTVMISSQNKWRTVQLSSKQWTIFFSKNEAVANCLHWDMTADHFTTIRKVIIFCFWNFFSTYLHPTS